MKSNCSALKHVLVLGFAILGIAQLPAQTSFSGGNVATATDWTNGLPSPDNDGTIAQSGIANNVFFNVASGIILVSHTEGSLTGTPNLQNTGAAPVQWTQSGGTFSATNFFVVNNRVTYELTGTGLINFASVTGGSRLQVVNAGGTLVQSGGTIDGMALAFENSTGSNTLSGGEGLNLGASWAGGAAIRVLNSTVNITGDYTATINSGFSNAAGLTSGVLSMEGSGVLNFSPTWTGSLSQTAFNGTTKWQNALTQNGVRVGGTQVTIENFGEYFAIVDNGVTVVSVDTSVTAGTRFIGNNVAIATHWTNGLPNVGKDGSIAASGTISRYAIDFVNSAEGTVAISHTAGTLTGADINLRNSGTTLYQWTQSGGTFSATNFFLVNNRVTYELTGTGLINFASVTGGSRLQVVNAGSWVQSGGTTDGMALAFENPTGSNTLSGGEGLNVGASWPGGAAIRVLNSTVNITGDYTATINSGFSNAAGLTSGVLSMEGSGVLDFSPTWTGSLSQIAFNGTTKWQNALTQNGVRVGGTQVTIENFGDYFAIIDNGVTVVTRPPDTLWTGATNNVWDINSTSNWISDGSPVNYTEGGFVIFDDSASTTTVTLDTIVNPSIVTFNNASKNYTLGGTGSIAGITGLTKSGAATLILANTNTYTGNTAILAGTLTLTGRISSGAGTVSMRDGTSLNVTASGNNPAISTTGDMFVGTDFNNPAGMNTITFDGLSSLSVAPITVGSLFLDSPVTVNITGVRPVVGQYPLFQYTSEYEVHDLSLGSLPDGFTATLVDDIESQSIYLDVTAAPGSGAPFDEWTASFDLVGDEALPGADPDNDGLNNLLEFVLGGNPKSGVQASVGPKVQTTANDLILTFNRSSASKLQPVGLKVQISGDLNTWNPADDIVIGATSGSSYTVTEMDGYDLIVVTISKSGPTRFARVTAELP
jgi:autotransporter-associated beta strand protein